MECRRIKIKIKKAKELGKKNEGIKKDKAAKIITNEINSRAKLNMAATYLQKKMKKYKKNK